MVEYIIENNEVRSRISGCEMDAVFEIAKHHPYVELVLIQKVGEEIDSDWRTALYNQYKKSNFKGLPYGLDRAIMKGEFTGVGRPLEGDTYDEHAGVEAANSKMLEKYHNSRKKAINRWVKHQRAILNGNILMEDSK